MVAIKAIPLAADNQIRRRAEANFLQEAKSAAGLSHPGIVTVFDAGKTESVAYIAMERLYGSDLHDWLALRDKLNPKTIASLMARVADAVHYAHRRGLIHRDLKPSNVFLTRDMKPKVLDFGVALAQYSDSRPHRQPPADRHAQLHVAGAGAGTLAGRAQRCVLDGCHHVRAAHRTSSVRRRAGRGHAAAGVLRVPDSDP